MPLLCIDGQEFEVPQGRRLVLAIEEAGIPILHRCGGQARCTTCRVRFHSGEPERMTQAEEARLRQDAQPLYGKVRLSCQIVCDRDMDIIPLMTLDNEQVFVDSPGPRPHDQVSLEPVRRRADPK